MARPKVAFITPGSFPIPSPGSSSVERVVEKMVPLLQPGIEARIYGRASKTLRRIGTLNGVRCDRYPAHDKSLYIRRISKALTAYKPDIIEVENRPGYVIRLRKRHPNARIWLNLHSATFIRSGIISTKTLRYCFSIVERIIVNSQFLHDFVISRVPEAAYKVSVVHIGVEPDRFLSRYTPQGAERREQLRAAKGWTDRKVILFMGRLMPYKGVHHLLEALPTLIPAYPNMLLVIVGSPFYGSHRTTAYSRKLRMAARQYSGYVTFVNYVPYQEVPDWFLAADIAVVPSDAMESFGLVNVEAMACGLPVVASEAGGIKEIVQHEETGFLVPLQAIKEQLPQRLLELLGDEQLRMEMGRKGRERIENHFTWNCTAERWLALIEGKTGKI